MAKRISKATVATALKTMDTEGLTVELTSDTVLFWYDSASEEQTKKAEAAVTAVQKATGSTHCAGNGSHLRVAYKTAPEAQGDWNDKASRCHY